MERANNMIVAFNKENTVIPNGKNTLARPKTASVRTKKSTEKAASTNLHAPSTNLCKVSSNIHSCIFKYLTSHELLMVSHVCHSLRESAAQEHVWEYQLGKESRTTPSKNSAKISYLIQQAILRNYFRPKSKNFKLVGHNKAITSIAIDGDYVLTGSKDGFAKFWNIYTKRAYSLEHSNMVTNVIFFNGMPITSSADHTVRVWDYTNGECKGVLRGHKACVLGLKGVKGNVFASASFDSLIKLWDSEKLKCCGTIAEHSGPISCFDANEKWVASSSDPDPYVALVDASTGKLYMKLATKHPQAALNRSPKNDVSSIKLTDENLIFTGETKKIRLWDLRASHTKAQTDVPAPTAEEEKKKSLNSQFNLPSSLTMASATTRMRYQESLGILAASFTSLNGIATFDIRNPRQELNLYNYHYYPVTSFDTGCYFNEHVGISAGTTKILQYDLRVMDLRKSKEDNQEVKIIPGHQAVITQLAMKDGVVVTGAKNGSVVAMNFQTFSTEMKVLPSLSIIKC